MPRKDENTHGVTNTILGKGSVLEGSFQVENDVTIYATLKGELTCTGTVVVGESGYLEANVRAEDVIITGKVVGNVAASNKVVLRSGAVLIGDLRARLLAVEEGAVLQGSCDSGPEADISESDERGSRDVTVVTGGEQEGVVGE
jgi:cytoskeletal protein CcmA (bactofilin family)